MAHSESMREAVRRTRSPASSSCAVGPTAGVTIYGCDPDEAVLFLDLAPRFGVLPTLTRAPVAEDTIDLAFGNRCISVDHKTRISNHTLFALSRAGVEYISTRSIGYDHVDVKYADSVGITVGNVPYSPDCVADYTLMLMVLRDAKLIIRRTDAHDYRLSEARGRELRDLTVGVVGTGRIGAGVITRLRGFGCRVLAYDNDPKTAADYVPLDDLLRESDVVTLHIPLTADTFHLLNHDRIGTMKRGAVVVNTSRGSLLDTEGLLFALESGRLGSAALDVLEAEEGIFYADCRTRPIANPLLLQLQDLPNVVITPHTAHYTGHALRDIVENSLLNCVNYENGKHGG